MNTDIYNNTIMNTTIGKSSYHESTSADGYDFTTPTEQELTSYSPSDSNSDATTQDDKLLIINTLKDTINATINYITTIAVQINTSSTTSLPKTTFSSTVTSTTHPSESVSTRIPPSFTPYQYEAFHKDLQHVSRDDISHGHVAAATVLAALSMILLVVVVWVYCRRRSAYEHIEPEGGTRGNGVPDFVYKPLIGAGGLDEEYENTFVGVSIPLLQDNTKL